MKKYADPKRRFHEFQVGQWVWLKLQPYRQHSVERRKFQKLSMKFYGPFLVEKKINEVAYRLALPPECKIFPVFHIDLLKDFKGDNPSGSGVTIPPLTTESHPVVLPRQILAYRVIKRKDKQVGQVLIKWLGLGPEDKTWEDVETISRLVPSANLEDKVKTDGVGDVTIGLDLNEVTRRLKEDLPIEEIALEDPQSAGPHDSNQRPVRTRKGKHDSNFVYY